MNISPFTHPVFPDETIRTNETESNQQNIHRLNKREARNTTVDNKDSYVIVPTATKRTLHKSGDNRRISVVVHNITALISDDSRMADDIRGDSTAPSYRYDLQISHAFSYNTNILIYFFFFVIQKSIGW